MNLLEQYQENKDFIVSHNKEYDLYCVKYKHGGIDWSNPIALQARGLVLDREGNIVARPYKKFFNYNELKGTELEHLSAWDYYSDYTVETKVDGSLATFFSHKGKILCASSGNVMGIWGKHFLDAAKRLTDIEQDVWKFILEDMTLVAEYVSPDHKIVLDYEEEKFIAHALINNQTGAMCSLDIVADGIGMDLVESWEIDSVDDLIVLQKSELNTEGYVVKFKSGHILKFKTNDYFEKHVFATTFFGGAFTKRKIENYVDMIKTDKFDDLMGLPMGESTRSKLQGIKELVSYAMYVKGYCEMLIDEGVTKKDYFSMPKEERGEFYDIKLQDKLFPIIFDGREEMFWKSIKREAVNEYQEKRVG